MQHQDSKLIEWSERLGNCERAIEGSNLRQRVQSVLFVLGRDRRIQDALCKPIGSQL